jgi:hypothetical protein
MTDSEKLELIKKIVEAWKIGELTDYDTLLSINLILSKLDSKEIKHLLNATS